MSLNERVEEALRALDPDSATWPTGEQVEAIAEAVTAWEDETRPRVAVMRADPFMDPGSRRWIVQIDTTEGTGHVTVYLNDADALWDQDPEV